MLQNNHQWIFHSPQNLTNCILQIFYSLQKRLNGYSIQIPSYSSRSGRMHVSQGQIQYGPLTEYRAVQEASQVVQRKQSLTGFFVLNIVCCFSFSILRYLNASLSFP